MDCIMFTQELMILHDSITDQKHCQGIMFAIRRQAQLCRWGKSVHSARTHLCTGNWANIQCKALKRSAGLITRCTIEGELCAVVVTTCMWLVSLCHLYVIYSS